MRQAAEAKLGFYPVSNEALGLLARAFRVDGDTAILDPCAGEGAAIRFLGETLGVPLERTYAIELAENRALKLAENLPGAKRLGPASFMATHVSPGSFGLTWVNPPFQDEIGGGKRVEYSFLAHTTPLLVKGGVMAFLMPQRAMSWEVERFFHQHYEDVRKMPLPGERLYDEVLLVGKRRADPTEIYESVSRCQVGDVTWTIPKAPGPRTFLKTGPTPAELQRLLAKSPLNRVFDPPREKPIGRPPLPLGKGHLALLLASGQLNGVVPSDPPHVVRGSSQKEEYISETKCEENEKTGAVTTTTIKREKVVLIVRTVDASGDIQTLEGEMTMYIRYATKDTQARVACDRLAYHEDGRILVLSCYGPQQTLRGLGAVLTSDVKTRLEHYGEDDCVTTLTKDGCGYRTYRHLLCQGLWHFLWISKDPQLLVAGKEALGAALQGSAFTTPLLPGWVPHIQRELEEKGLLMALSGDRGGYGPAYLTATTQDLDEIVSNGIKSGALKIA